MMTVDPIEISPTSASDAVRRVFPDGRRFAAEDDAGGRFPSPELAGFDYLPSGLSPITELAWELGLIDPE